MMSEEEEGTKYVDLAVSLPMRKKPVTTAMQVALIGEGEELNASGYHRHDFDHMRTLFIPSTGEMALELEKLDFGQVMHPVKIDALALMARDTIILMLPSNMPARMGPQRLYIPRVRFMKVPLVQ